jgi:hypothetical protein
MKWSKLKERIGKELKAMGKSDFEITVKSDGYIYDICSVFTTHEENGVEDAEKEANTIVLRASQ